MRLSSEKQYEMDRGVHFHQKFINMKYQRVKAEESFLPESEDDEIEVEHLLTENDNYLGNCLKLEDFSAAFDYGLQKNSGGLDANSKHVGEDELKFGDLDQLLNGVEEVDDIHATNGLSGTCEDSLLDIEFSERTTTLNGDSCEGSHLGKSNSASQSSGLSGTSSGAVPISGLSQKTISELDGKNDSHSTQDMDKLDNHDSPSRNDMSDEMDKSYLETNDLGACSRERRLRKPTRRFIEEFSESMSKSHKGRGRLSTNALSVLHCGTSFQSVSKVRRGRPKKNAPPPSLDFHQSDEESSAYESEDDHVMTKRYKKCDRRKHQRMWALTEVIKLVDGIAEFGTGRWTDIKRNLFSSSAYRTPIDLRDKWRNLLRASRVHKMNKKGIEQKQTHTLRPLPKSLLRRVRELAKIHPYPKERS